MYCFYLNGKGITASFRVPETHTFHQTLPLPPKTMMVGLMGAALGFSVQEAHTFAREHGILVSISGTHKGFMKDLWNYRKVTSKEFSRDEMKTRPHYSVLTREYLVYPSFTFVYASEKCESLEKVRDAFTHPVYALTAGNSDDLLKVQFISEIKELQAEKLAEFKNTILPGDMSQYCTYDIESMIRDKHVTFSVKMPEVFSLPTTFSFAGEMRIGIESRPFTFIRDQITLRESIDGYRIEENNYVLY
jgi:CRISPR-associated protein Cas5t